MVHNQMHMDENQKNRGFSLKIMEILTAKPKGVPSFIWNNLPAILLLAVVWGLLAFYEPALLFRVNELSVFLYDNIFFEEMMSMPAGILYYAASFLVQFFYYPVLGATVYVALLAVVYWLTYKVFDIPVRYRILALLPVAALLASNTQLGYWIFYLKIPGYYYVALLGVLLSLLAAWVVKKANVYLTPLLIVGWISLVYPVLGVYALTSGVIMAIQALCRGVANRKGVAQMAVSFVALPLAVATAYIAPRCYYKHYTTVPIEGVYTVGLPASQWKSEHVPDNSVKMQELSLIDGINGRVGYPVKKALTKYMMNIDGSFSPKAIATAKSELYGGVEINRPMDGKEYTLTFVCKDGSEYYLNGTGREISVAKKDAGSEIPQTGRFVCEVKDKNKKELVMLKAQSGQYLVWNKELVDSVERYVATLADSPLDGNAVCAFAKMKKEGDVRVTDNSELFGIVNLIVLDADGAGGYSPYYVAGLADGVLTGSSAAVLNDTHTSALRVEEVGFRPLPFPLTLQERSIWYNVNVLWVPFILLLALFVVLAAVPVIALYCGRCETDSLRLGMYVVVPLSMVLFCWLFWYGNDNFRVENEQNRAMWNEDWKSVAELSRVPEVPTRQVVMNKNVALHKLGRAGSELFAYPEGSADIEASVPVRLAQTGGKMTYYQYGKFNFCYRWCVEDAVEYGWRIEYLKHAVRSMLLAGEHRLAQRYINILKRTMFYAGWAGEMEEYIKNPERIKRNREFAMPLDMTCYEDFLDVDESYVEAYLTKNLLNSAPVMSRTYVEAALAAALTRKDSKSFWFFLNYYVNEFQPNSLPKHYQEAALLFMNVDKGRTVQVPKAFIDKFISVGTNGKMTKFMQLVSQHKGKSEEEMAPFFKEDFGETYFYFYFFVRNIKTN